MKRIEVSALVPGMILARDLFDQSGILLMPKNTRLTNDFISKLKNRQVTEVEINEPSPSMREEQEAILAPQISAAHDRVVGMTESLMSNANEISEVDPHIIKGMVGDLNSQIEMNTNVLLNLSHLKTHDNYLFSHAVNVSMMALIIGRELHLGPNELQDLGIAALLHDIGMVKIDQAIFNKEGALLPEEWVEIKRHPEYGYDLLISSGNYSDPILRGIREHHERMDGSGYPRGLKHQEIHLFGKILAVADVYDACISSRKHRKRLTPHETLQNLLGQSNLFAGEILRAFVSAMAIYPIGSFIRLNTGEIAKVVGIHHGQPFRPDIQIFFDRAMQKMEQPVRINLSDEMYIQNYVESTVESEKLEEIHRVLGD